MFTGLVQELAKVRECRVLEKGLFLRILSPRIAAKSSLGDSIAVNGCCLTVVDKTGDSFAADVMKETVDKTNLKRLRPGDEVNLETSLTLQTPLGGHLVTGDVDGEVRIDSIRPVGQARLYRFQFPGEAVSLMRYIVSKGRITLDGASLTVINPEKKAFSVSLIPHTLKMVTLGKKKVGDYINVEVDLVGKYIEKFMQSGKEES